MEPKKYQVWDSEESAETAIEVEAETPSQAAFFAANIRKPQTTYQVRVENVSADAPAIA